MTARLSPILGKTAELRKASLEAQIEMAKKKGFLSLLPYLKAQIEAIDNGE